MMGRNQESDTWQRHWEEEDKRAGECVLQRRKNRRGKGGEEKRLEAASMWKDKHILFLHLKLSRGETTVTKAPGFISGKVQELFPLKYLKHSLNMSMWHIHNTVVWHNTVYQHSFGMAYVRHANKTFILHCTILCMLVYVYNIQPLFQLKLILITEQWWFIKP